MRRARITLIGRPNVGKSSLFNSLLGFKRAIVYDISGTTVDEIEERPRFSDDVLLVDSQGVFDETHRGPLDRAIEGSDAIMFVVDGLAGCTPYDRWLAKEIQKSKKPVLLIINKMEKKSGRADEFVELGLGVGQKISAAHRKNIQAVKDWCAKQATKVVSEEERDGISEKADLTLSIIGRPNAGKSTLFNQLCQSDKAKTSPVEHTTRDALAWEVPTPRGLVKLFDTAGMRRRRMKGSHIEKLSVHQANKWVKQSDVVFVLINASEELTEQDLKIVDSADESGKPVALLLNFWDQIDENQRRFLLKAMKVHPILQRFRYMQISAKTGFNTKKLFDLAFELQARAKKRVSTAKLNKVVKELVQKNPPPMRGNRRFNLLYASQVDTSPPTFVFFMNRKGALPTSYQSYLTNELRDRFDLRGLPIRVNFRAKEEKRPRG